MIHPEERIHPDERRAVDPRIHPWKWPKPASGGRRVRPHSGPARERREALLPVPEPLEFEPRRHVLPEGKPELRLSNARWAEDRGEFGERAIAYVDAEAPPTAATRVIFKAWAEWGRGLRMDLPDAEGHVGTEGGIVQAAFVLNPPFENGVPVAACRYRFTAKHSLSDAVTSGPLEAGPGTPFDGLIYYCPAREEYLMLPAEADVRRLLEESRRIEELRDRAMRAREDPDPVRRGEELRAAEKESEALFGGTDEGRAKDGLLELLQVGGNPRWGRAPAWTRVRGHERNGGATWVDAYWRKATDKQVRRELDRLLSPRGASRASPLLKSRFKAHLFAAEPKAGDLWHWARQDGKPEGARTDTEGTPPAAETRRFSFTPEAALGRYFAGWDGGEASYDPEKKGLRLGVAGTASFALFEGKVALAVELPDPGGLNLVAWLGAVKFRDAYLADPRRSCLLKLRVEGSLAAFVGGTVQGALSLTGSFAKVPQAGIGGEGHGFAGAQARMECEGSLLWAAARTGPFAALATLTGGAGASAGIGGEGSLQVEYRDGVFRFKLAAALCLGLGLKERLALDVEVREAVALLGHLCDCVDFHFIGAIAKDAFAAFRDHALGFFTAEPHPEAGLRAAIHSRLGERSRLRRTPPEALGRLLATLMETREAENFQGIRYILGSCVRGNDPSPRVSPDHKLKWVLRCVSALPIPEADGPEREAKKGEALEEGIRILRDFARAEGRRKGPGRRPDAEFAAWLEDFLAANGLGP